MHMPGRPLTLECSAETGLMELEYFDVAHAVLDLPGAWSVQVDRDDRGCSSISIVSDNGEDDDLVQVFLLWCENWLLCLSYGQGDFYASLGCHAHVEAAMAAARGALEGSAAVTQWIDELSFPRASGNRRG